MKQTLKLRAKRIVHDEQGRQAYFALHGEVSRWFGDIQLAVPTEQPLDVGDIVNVTIDWP